MPAPLAAGGIVAVALAWGILAAAEWEVARRNAVRLQGAAESFADTVRGATMDGRIMGGALLLGIVDDGIRKVATGELPPDAPEAVRGLEQFRAAYGAEDALVVNGSGRIVAYRLDPSLGTPSGLGRDLSFRPYVQQALKGVANIYPAVGKNTHHRGLYYAAPVRAEASPNSPVVGVIAIKVAMEQIDALMTRWPHPAMLVSPLGGVVMASNRGELVFGTLGNPTPEILAALQASKQFDTVFDRGPPRVLPAAGNGGIITLGKKPYDLAEVPIEWNDPAGAWSVVVLDDRNSLLTPVERAAIFLTAAAVLLSFWIVLFFLGRFSLRKAAYLDRIRKLGLAIEQGPTAVIITNALGEIEYVNSRFCEQTGYDVEEAKGRRMEFLRAGVTPSEVYEDLWRTIRGGGKWRGELVNRTKGGAEFFASVHVAPLFAPSGEITHFVSVHEDITERKGQERAYLEAKEEAEAATRAKSAFLATMSHEIRTPMNGVATMIELLQKTPLAYDQREMLAIVADSSAALLAIIDDILDFSKIEAGRFEIERVPYCPADVAEAVGDLLAPRADEKGLDLVVWIDPALPAQVMGDPARTRQILVNLVGNAIKFTQSGVVELAVRPALAGQIEFAVTDTGIGIAEERQARLFTPFAQAETSTARRFGGTGLGLSICRTLAQMMGGGVWVDSKLGHGACFRCRVSAETVEPPTLREPVLTGLRVLAAGGSGRAAAAWRGYLEHAGARVTLCEPQEVTGTLLRADSGFDVCVVDTARAGGAGVTEVLKRHPEVKMVRLVTRSTDRPGDEPAVIKPARYASLTGAVARAAGRGGAIDPRDGGGSAARKYQAPSRAEALAAGTLILVAEDNRTNQLVIGRVLDYLGLAHDFADDGVAALERLVDTPYGLLLTDGHMPRMGGFDLARAVREQERGTGRHLPIIALTADVLSDTAQRCRDAGMDDILIKPVSTDRLEQVVRHTLPKAIAMRRGADSVVIDVSAIRDLFGGVTADLWSMLDGFFAGSKAALAELAAAGDGTQAAEAVHKLAGGARMVGAITLADLATQAEHAFLAGDDTRGQTLAAGLGAALADSERAIRSALGAE